MDATTQSTVALVLSGTGTVVSLFSGWVAWKSNQRAREAHEWLRRERAGTDEKRARCEELRERVRAGGEPPQIGPDELTWARWGEENHYFSLIDVSSFDGSAWLVMAPGLGPKRSR
jgi:hypothetical protein